MSQFEIVRSYYDKGPRESSPEKSDLLPLGASRYGFNWTVSDQLKAVLAAGCEVVDVAEWGDHGGEDDDMPERGLPTPIHSREEAEYVEGSPFFGSLRKPGTEVVSAKALSRRRWTLMTGGIR